MTFADILSDWMKRPYLSFAGSKGEVVYRKSGSSSQTTFKMIGILFNALLRSPYSINRKPTLQIDIYEGEDAEKIIAKFAIFKQLTKKLFTVIKRTINLRVIVVDPLPVDSKVMKNLTRLNQLVNVEILLKDPTLYNLLCVDNFLSSSRTKKIFPKLQSPNIDLAYERDLTSTSPGFTGFTSLQKRLQKSTHHCNRILGLKALCAFPH